ncbi:MAG: thioredoxin domain-containing protein [Pseudomonadota bacterium]|nr:thioredoxin domain-containing protein [Pseudomonadota bacterium]MDP2352619.1 thioredoxin domain-containing protein [Pseudomonadota bacterium]
MNSAAFLLVAGLLFAVQACTAEEPGAALSPPPALQQKLDAALAAKGPAYRPRTEHLLPDGKPRYTNRLILEDSPYLIQHAHNPVDWFAWGEEAFDKARRENKPIFLSIGYSTCHWCHVMEVESFENPEIARLLNAHFVAIKVDRETRPDLDHLYMTAVNLLTGHGGWPMTTLLTPEGKVFYGGTYFRPDDLARLLGNADRAWREQRQEIQANAAQVTQAVEKAMAVQAGAAELKPELAAETARGLLQGHDELQGGFGHAPKFPNEPLLALWLDQVRRGGEEATPVATPAAILDALETDLAAMAAGGIHDQAGGGFHRYATDSDWLVPHFEKMLYNQAQLARLYVGAYALTGKDDYARVARRALDFVLREMTAPSGGFYSALDADSEGGEGRYYLWTPAEIRKALNAEDAAFAIHHYSLTESGNFEGSNILHLSKPVTGAERVRLDRIDAALLKAREKRPYPHRDDKVLTGWNGLMIAALAEAAGALHEPRYLDAAKRAAEFLWQKHRRPNGGLWRASLAGRAGTPGMLEDYAYLAEGLIALYDATLDEAWLARAQTLADAMAARFGSSGAYPLAEADPLSPLPRPRDTADGALPSANGVAVHVLAALARRSGETRFEVAAQSQLAALAGTIAKNPSGHATLLTAADRLRLGETGPRQYAGRGAVVATAKATRQDANKVSLELTLDLKTGWHINGHRPLQDYLIPTSLKAGGQGWHIVRVDYPEALVTKLGFQKEALALYQGKILIRAELERKSAGAGGVPLELRLQACSDRVCLPPETLRLEAALP